MIELPPLDREAVLAGLDSLLGLPGGADDHVRFRRSLLEAQLAVLDRLAVPPVEPDGSKLAEALSLLLEQTAADGRAVGPLQRLLADASASPGALAGWVHLALTAPSGPALQAEGRRLGLPPEALAFYGAVLAAPFVHALVRSRPRPPVPTAPGEGCPCCGSAPGLALVTAPDGRRVLACGTCAARWEQPRLACPGCGAEGTQVVLRDPDRPRTWLEACTACRGALPTVDLRQGATWGSAVLPLVERTASLYLDLLAEAGGYTPLHAYAALL